MPAPEGAGAWILSWFAELSARRGWVAVAGLGGGALIPASLGFAEIESWARLTDSRPTPWEVRVLLAMDESWRAAYGGKEGGGRKHQGIGDYCQGERVEGCRQMFGDALERVCSTCPS